MYPGQFPNVRHNLFNIVLVVDLSQTSALQFIAGSLSSIVNRGFPFRFGVVPIMENEEGECCRSDVLWDHAHYLHLLRQVLRWRGFSATLWNIMAKRERRDSFKMSVRTQNYIHLCSIITLFRSHGRISHHTWRRLLIGLWSVRSSKYLQVVHRMNMSPLTLTHLCEERQPIL
jgi:hypothetical protein